MTITQTVDITDDYRVTLEPQPSLSQTGEGSPLDIPRSIPKGRTNLTILFPVKEKPKADNDIPRFTKKEFDELMKDCPHTQAISGILSILGDIDLDEWRMKRLAKHL